MKQSVQITFRRIAFALLGIMFVLSCRNDVNAPMSLTKDDLADEISADVLASDNNFVSLTQLRSNLLREMMFEISKLPADEIEQMKKAFHNESLFVNAMKSGKIKAFSEFQDKTSALVIELDHTYNIRSRASHSLANSFNKAQQILLNKAKGAARPGSTNEEGGPIPDTFDCSGWVNPELCVNNGSGRPRTQEEKFQDCAVAATITLAGAVYVCDCCNANPANCRQIAATAYSVANALCLYKYITGGF